MLKTMFKSTIVAGALVFTVGCASNAAMELEPKVDQAMRKAESAQATANEAQRTANRAMQIAQEAKQAAQANSQRIERMFEASQRK